MHHRGRGGCRRGRKEGLCGGLRLIKVRSIVLASLARPLSCVLSCGSTSDAHINDAELSWPQACVSSRSEMHFTARLCLDIHFALQLCCTDPLLNSFPTYTSGVPSWSTASTPLHLIVYIFPRCSLQIHWFIQKNV